jgi:Glycosyltransferase like family
VHQDAELADSNFGEKVRKALRDPDVAIVGCVGAVGVRSIAWWQGAVTWASFSQRYEEFGGGVFESLTWEADKAPSYAAPGEVDVVDGVVLVLSPWAVRNLRFDESLGQLHGYDFDICMQARAAGKKVVTADFRAIHHHSLELISNPEAWTAAYITLAEKWDGLRPDPGADPKRRALRAEAEAACAEGVGRSHWLRARALRRQLARRNQRLDALKEELEETGQELAETKQGLEGAKQELSAANRELEDTRRELQTLLARNR